MLILHEHFGPRSLSDSVTQLWFIYSIFSVTVLSQCVCACVRVCVWSRIVSLPSLFASSVQSQLFFNFSNFVFVCLVLFSLFCCFLFSWVFWGFFCFWIPAHWHCGPVSCAVRVDNGITSAVTITSMLIKRNNLSFSDFLWLPSFYKASSTIYRHSRNSISSS